MEEQFYTITKHATTLRIKSGVAKDGRITARECEVWWNGGAYADIGPRVTQKSGFTAAGPVRHREREDRFVRALHEPAAGRRAARLRHSAARVGVRVPYRHDRAQPRDGPAGVPAQEHPARGPPAGDRHRHARRRDRQGARARSPRAWTGAGRSTAGAGRSGAAAASRSASRPRSRRRPRSRSSTCYADGSCSLYCSTVDMGQGSDTAMAQIAAEVLGFPVESIAVVHPDTDVTPYDMGTLGSRSLYHMGHAVKRAAEDARDKLLALAGEVGLSAETTPIPELFRKKYGMQAGNVVGVGSFIPSYKSPDHDTGLSPDVTPFWMVGAAGVEVEVDTETGHVRVTKLVNVADVGTPINPADRRDPALGRGDHAARLHDVREDGVRRRPGDECLARRLQDPGHARHPAQHRERGGRRASRRAARSARKAWARRRRSASRRRSPTR